MAKDLKITLDESVTPWLVDIDQKDNANHVDRSANLQTLTWQLNGNAASGSIISFSWLNGFNGGTIFGSPSISANGNEMTMSDNNPTDGSAAGTYTYQLTIQVGESQYSTGATIPNPRAVTNNPSIKNN